MPSFQIKPYCHIDHGFEGDKLPKRYSPGIYTTEGPNKNISPELAELFLSAEFSHAVVGLDDQPLQFGKVEAAPMDKAAAAIAKREQAKVVTVAEVAEIVGSGASAVPKQKK